MPFFGSQGFLSPNVVLLLFKKNHQDMMKRNFSFRISRVLHFALMSKCKDGSFIQAVSNFEIKTINGSNPKNHIFK